MADVNGMRCEDSRLARVDEEHAPLSKHADFHFSSIASAGTALDDLDIDILREYIYRESSRPMWLVNLVCPKMHGKFN